jgi:hypothetical protein
MGSVAAAKSNAELPKSPRIESRAGQTRPASLHRHVGQGPEQQHGRAPEPPKGLHRQGHKGESRGKPTAGRCFALSRAAAANPRVSAAPAAYETAAGGMTDMSPTKSCREETKRMYAWAPGRMRSGGRRGPMGPQPSSSLTLLPLPPRPLPQPLPSRQRHLHPLAWGVPGLLALGDLQTPFALGPRGTSSSFFLDWWWVTCLSSTQLLFRMLQGRL